MPARALAAAGSVGPAGLRAPLPDPLRCAGGQPGAADGGAGPAEQQRQPRGPVPPQGGGRCRGGVAACCRYGRGGCIASQGGGGRLARVPGESHGFFKSRSYAQGVYLIGALIEKPCALCGSVAAISPHNVFAAMCSHTLYLRYPPHPQDLLARAQELAQLLLQEQQLEEEQE